jgi:hypothetical protein
MKYSKMSDYIGKSDVNSYGFILDTSSIINDSGIRFKMWKGIAALFTHIGDEWLPAPKDLAEDMVAGSELLMHFLDEGDQAKFLANPGHNYDYYVAENEDDIIGVFTILYNNHSIKGGFRTNFGDTQRIITICK